ncbi:hypothetical protein GCM10027280_47850 [Micromonospora polyrhachis]
MIPGNDMTETVEPDRRAAEVQGDPDGDGLAAQIAAAAGRRWWNRWTLCLGAVVLLLAGFMIGVQVQKSYGEPAAPAGRTAAGPGQRGGTGQGGFPGGAGQPSGAAGAGQPGAGTRPTGAASGTTPSTTTGTVKLVDGTTIYVQTADGTVLTVRTGTDTTIRIARDGTLKELKAGDPVTVEGPSTAGTVTATSVTGQGR